MVFFQFLKLVPEIVPHEAGPKLWHLAPDGGLELCD